MLGGKPAAMPLGRVPAPSHPQMITSSPPPAHPALLLSPISQAASHDLYWATGDGGPQQDPLNTGQDTSNTLGSIIRISVPADGTGYTIPSGNLASERGDGACDCPLSFATDWQCVLVDRHLSALSRVRPRFGASFFSGVRFVGCS